MSERMNVGCWCVWQPHSSSTLLLAATRQIGMRSSRPTTWLSNGAIPFMFYLLFVVFKYPQFVALLWGVAMASMQLVWIKSSLAIMAWWLPGVSVCVCECMQIFVQNILWTAIFDGCYVCELLGTFISQPWCSRSPTFFALSLMFSFAVWCIHYVSSCFSNVYNGHSQGHVCNPQSVDVSN